MTSAPPKVFISYSHDTVEHQDRVLGFADRLRADGIDAEIDQYNPAPAEGWPLWCERQIKAADVVLMVCTETYHRRVSGDEEQGKGLGVVWEARIIRQLLYDFGTASDKFVPVLFSDASPEHIPTAIKGGARYVVDTEDGYEELYRRLTRQPSLVRPPIGTIRPLPPRRRQWTEAQSATTAPAPLSSGASSPKHGDVTAGSNRSMAIGGNMINSAAIFGDHNVTSINTASDHNEEQRHKLHEFSQSAECAAIIRQIYTAIHNYYDAKAKQSLHFLAFFFGFIGYCLFLKAVDIRFPNTFYFLSAVCIIAAFFSYIFYRGHFTRIHRILAVKRKSWFTVFPTLILEKNHNNYNGVTTVLEKADGSRIALETFHRTVSRALPGDIGVAVTRFNFFLISFNICRHLQDQEPLMILAGEPLIKFDKYKSSPSDKTVSMTVTGRVGRGIIVLILDFVAFATIGIALGLNKPELWWGLLFASSVFFSIAVYALFLILSGIVGGIRGMCRKFGRRSHGAAESH